MNINSVPVLMYHSVKYKPKDSWIHKHLTLTLSNFDRHIKLICALKLKTYFISELTYHLNGEYKLPLNSLLLTFDDGYLDNYTFLWPLLKKHKIKATIWVNPEFIDNNSKGLRPTLEDYWDGKIALDELNDLDGYLNWDEMHIMEKSGFIDIQSHTMTHTKYPVSDSIIDFINPSSKIDWLYWNLFPEDKPFFLTKPRFQIPLGQPVYESQKGNIAVKYEENGILTQNLIEYVKKKGSTFFEHSDWRNILFKISEEVKNECKVQYKMESQEEYESRIKYELAESKRILEQKLEKKINHVCWPFGGWNDTTLKIAKESGYISSTAKGQKNVFNKSNKDRIDRFSWDNQKFQNRLFYLYGLYKLLNYKL